MKIMHEHVDFPGRSPIKVKMREMPHFTYPWHFHNEYELLYVLNGSGTSFVADSIKPFHSGDLVLLGSNLPHFWKSDASYLDKNGHLSVKYIVIQFPGDFLRTQISSYPEFHLIGNLLEHSLNGIRFSPSFAQTVSKKVIKTARAEGFNRMLLLLDLLQVLAKTNAYKLLSSNIHSYETRTFTSDRMTKVMHYVSTNYHHKINLEKIAGIASMHPSAFCRYFKEKTGKSLSKFVNDLRISYACKLIIENRLSVSQICFESGFNNLSNFNRMFKRQIGYTPTNYLHQFHNHL